MKWLAGLTPFVMLGGCAGSAVIPPLRPVTKPAAATEDGISVYFSPEGGAMAAIIAELDRAKQTIDVEAYLITSQAIGDALKAAKDRGVNVRIILDKNHSGGIFSLAAYLSRTGLTVWRDGAHKDHHNNVMVIDGSTIVPGSFNFTDQAEALNAENLLVIRGRPKLAATYLAEFEALLRHTDPPKP